MVAVWSIWATETSVCVTVIELLCYTLLVKQIFHSCRQVCRLVENLGWLYPIEISSVRCTLGRTIASLECWRPDDLGDDAEGAQASLRVVIPG